ncbi:MAG: hypothetical protein DRQ51_07270 [Gammaproteobacteria bacterium]|nr:MAG: hypothetical protein DRQ51_07270 [Gammaproteobacteria bacterium]
MQLPLKLNKNQSFADFFIPQNSSNKFVLDSLQNIEQSTTQIFYLFGDKLSGKSLLCSSLCQQFTNEGKTALLFSAYDNRLQLKQLDAIDLICLENIEAYDKNKIKQQQLFDLINRIITKKTAKIVISCHKKPNQFVDILPDLKSRLNWGLQLHLKNIKPNQMNDFIRFKLDRLGIRVQDEVLTYINNYFSRDIKNILELIKKISQKTINDKRTLTVPFLKSFRD